MGWLLSIMRAVPALKSILEQLGKLLRNAKADTHVTHSHRDIDGAIARVRVAKSKASERKQADRGPREGL